MLLGFLPWSKGNSELPFLFGSVQRWGYLGTLRITRGGENRSMHCYHFCSESCFSPSPHPASHLLARASCHRHGVHLCPNAWVYLQQSWCSPHPDWGKSLPREFFREKTSPGLRFFSSKLLNFLAEKAAKVSLLYGALLCNSKRLCRLPKLWVKLLNFH